MFYPEGYHLNKLKLLLDGSLLAYPLRFNADGTFRQIYPRISPSFTARDVSVQADGRILVVGEQVRDAPCIYPCGTDFTVARLLP